MIHVKYLILGGGPSGLSFAHTLLDSGEDNFLLLDKESEAGGLCRSQEVDGAPLDIGGGHFLDMRRQEVLELLFRFMPREEWNQFDRISKITLRGVEIDHPLEANLWQLPVEAQVDFLESIAAAGSVQGLDQPESFKDWISWKLGDRIAQEYMLPYNSKIWSMDLDLLGTYWLYKLPNVSFRETLQSCLERRALGQLPAHAQFLYPRKHGYGEVWKRMAEALGDRWCPGTEVSHIDTGEQCVNRAIRYDHLVTSIPWTLWPDRSDMPTEVADQVRSLVHVGIDVDYYPETGPSPAHWIYDPSLELSHHRRLLRSNFAPGARGYWTETNSQRSQGSSAFRHRNEFAYPVNTLGKPAAVEAIQAWALEQSILPLGRWGTWEHMNSDVAVSLAIQAAHQALGRGAS